MLQYVDFDFYENAYCGTTLTEEEFDSVSIEASYYINSLTMGRINAEEPIEEVKMATCKVADIIKKEKVQNDGKSIASESVGPHSVSYANTFKTTEQYDIEKKNAIMVYLANTGLMYRGIPHCNF